MLIKMSSVTKTDITALLDKWSEAKNKIVELEKRIEKYKLLANRIMDRQDIDSISSTYYVLKRKNISRTTISKQDVPEHVWQKYARSCTYPAYYLTEKK
jgi:hypothetical protein